MSAWTVIAHTEVPSGGASDITFLNTGNISSAYTDLLLVFSIRTDRNNTWDYINAEFNTSAANMTVKGFQGGDGTTYNISGTVARFGTGNGDTATSNTFSSHSIYIPNYAGNTNKSFSVDSVGETNAANGTYQDLIAGLWSQTAAITKIKIFSEFSSTILQYSSATLYGITKGSSGGVTVS